MRGWVVTLATTISLHVAAALPAEAAAPDPAELATHDWLEVRTPHFTILSDAREGLAAPAARRVEEMSEVFRILHPGLRPHPTLPVDVYVFRDDPTMAAFTPAGTENISGYTTEGPGRAVFVMNANLEGAERSYVAAHEYTHLFIRANFEEMPIWMNEGLAQYFQTLRIRGSKAEFAHGIDWIPDWLDSHEWADLDLLFAMKTSGQAYQRDNDLRTTTYAEGWAITHYLQAKPDRAARYDSILVALRHGKQARMAFRSQYPPEQWPGIIAGAKQHTKDRMFNSRSLQLPSSASSWDPVVRPVRTSEALLRLGDLLLTGDREGLKSAAVLYSGALREDSTLARAHAGLGYLSDLSGDSTSADASYLRATRRAPSDTRVHLLTGSGLLRRAFMGERALPPEALQAIAARSRASFEVCLKANRDDPEALGGLAYSLLIAEGVTDPAVSALERAADLLPSRKELKRLLADVKKEQQESAPDATEGKK